MGQRVNADLLTSSPNDGNHASEGHSKVSLGVDGEIDIWEITAQQELEDFSDKTVNPAFSDPFKHDAPTLIPSEVMSSSILPTQISSPVGVGTDLISSPIKTVLSY